eukprot:4918490-Prymnesium_polylepis.1
MLLECGVRADSPSFDQRCALHQAAAEGNIKATELILSHRAKVNVRDRWGGTPLRDAVRGGHTKLALMLRKAGGSLGYAEVEAAGELCEQAKSSNLQGIKLLLDCGLDCNAADCELVPPRTQSSCDSSLNLPLVAADDKRTALHLAASTGNMPIAKFLIDRGANVNARDRWGGTPLRDAVREGHKDVALMLRENSGELGYDETETSGELCELARRGNTVMIDVLLNCGAMINSADCVDRRPNLSTLQCT